MITFTRSLRSIGALNKAKSEALWLRIRSNKVPIAEPQVCNIDFHRFVLIYSLCGIISVRWRVIGVRFLWVIFFHFRPKEIDWDSSSLQTNQTTNTKSQWLSLVAPGNRSKWTCRSRISNSNRDQKLDIRPPPAALDISYVFTNCAMKIAVLGATGGSGVEFVKEALSAEHEVVAVVRTPSKLKIQHDKLKVSSNWIKSIRLTCKFI